MPAPQLMAQRVSVVPLTDAILKVPLLWLIGLPEMNKV